MAAIIDLEPRMCETEILTQNFINTAISWCNENTEKATPETSPVVRSVAAVGLIAITIAALYHNPFVGLTTLALSASYKKSELVHQRAEQENPNRSTIRKWASDPTLRLAFYAPAFICGTYGSIMNSQEDQVSAPTQEHLKESTLQSLIPIAIGILPVISDCYEIGKHSLRSLSNIYQNVNLNVRDSIKQAIIPLANLAFEAPNLIPVANLAFQALNLMTGTLAPNHQEL